MVGIRPKFSDGYPACVNDGNCAEAVLSAARTFLPGQLVGPPTPNMAGEDFAFFLSRKVFLSLIWANEIHCFCDLSF